MLLSTWKQEIVFLKNGVIEFPLPNWFFKSEFPRQILLVSLVTVHLNIHLLIVFREVYFTGAFNLKFFIV